MSQKDFGGQTRKSARDGKLLYHMTALDNLPGLLDLGLLSRAELQERGLVFGDVADPGILEKRALSALDRMVPFHFITRNPFDYGVARAWSTRRFVIVSVWRNFAAANGWSVIPMHPLTSEGEPEVLEWNTGIDAIDWAEMDKYPRHYETDHRCKMTCMAEALSPTPVGHSQWAYIYVPSDHTEKSVLEIVGSSVNVSVNNAMFPQGCL